MKLRTSSRPRRRMQRIFEQHVRGGEFIDDLGIPGISPEPLEPSADNSLVVLFARHRIDVVLFARHRIDPPLWLKASPPSNRVVSTSEGGGSYIRILRSDSGSPRAAKRAVRRAPRPNASHPGARRLAGMVGEEPADPARLKALLCPYPAEEMTCWPVSTRVGNVRNNGASLIEPAALGG
jgi:hypothetical protein